MKDGRCTLQGPFSWLAKKELTQVPDRHAGGDADRGIKRNRGGSCVKSLQMEHAASLNQLGRGRRVAPGNALATMSGVRKRGQAAEDPHEESDHLDERIKERADFWL